MPDRGSSQPGPRSFFLELASAYVLGFGLFGWLLLSVQGATRGVPFLVAGVALLPLLWLVSRGSSANRDLIRQHEETVRSEREKIRSEVVARSLASPAGPLEEPDLDSAAGVVPFAGRITASAGPAERAS